MDDAAIRRENCVLHCNHSSLCSIIITISMMTTGCVKTLSQTYLLMFAS